KRLSRARPREYVRRTGGIPAHRGGARTGRPRCAAARIRAAQGETREGRIVPAGAKETHSCLAAENRNCDVSKKRRLARHPHGVEATSQCGECFDLSRG